MMPAGGRYRWTAFLIVGTCLLAAGFSSDLRIQIGAARRSIEEHDRNGRPFYSLSQLARVLGLSLQIRGGVARVSGDRGTIVLTSNRPLVRVGDEYVLLSHPVWERSSDNWYVPADFLDKVLPSLLDRRLVRTGDDSYQLEEVDRNQVSVEIFEYPDHLSVVFRGTRPAQAEVREFHDFLSVSFDDSLVRPGTIDNSPEPGLIRSIDFAAQDALGSFRVRKGSRFDHFLEHQLADPPRTVLDIYGTRGTSAEATESEAPAGVPLDRPATPPVPDRSVPSPPPASDLHATEGGLVIDPGHGGVDYGVDVSPEVVEKVLTLELSELVDKQLQGSGEPTHLTRNRDVDLDLERRSAVANFYHAGAFITIHAGGAPTDAMRGPVVYIYEAPAENASDAGRPSKKRSSEEVELVPWELAQLPYLHDSRRLAGILQGSLNSLFGTHNSVGSAPLAVLAPIRAPAVVVEVGFLTNEKDLELLSQSEFREKVAGSIAHSLSQFLRSR